MATKTLVLCFNGCSLDEQRRIVTSIPGWKSPSEATLEPSFIGEFLRLQNEFGGFALFNFLDFNNDGIIDSTDTNIAVDEIMGAIRKKFQHFDVKIIREDNIDEAINIVTGNGISGDTLLTIAGREDGSGGQSDEDNANFRDSCGAAGHSIGAARIVAPWGGMIARERFINILSNVISHEAGHSFGLEHTDVPDAANINLMIPVLGDQVLAFQDEFWSNGINSYKTLLDNLGSSNVDFRTRITLKSNNNFVCAENGGGGVINANRTKAFQWEHFDLLYMADHTVAIETFSGQYVSAESGGGGNVIADRNWIRDWEKFTLVKTGPLSVTFRTMNGHYLAPASTFPHQISATATSPSSGFLISSIRTYIFVTQDNYWFSPYGGGYEVVTLSHDGVLLQRNQIINGTANLN